MTGAVTEHGSQTRPNEFPPTCLSAFPRIPLIAELALQRTRPTELLSTIRLVYILIALSAVHAFRSRKFLLPCEIRPLLRVRFISRTDEDWGADDDEGAEILLRRTIIRLHQRFLLRHGWNLAEFGRTFLRQVRLIADCDRPRLERR